MPRPSTKLMSRAAFKRWLQRRPASWRAEVRSGYGCPLAKAHRAYVSDVAVCLNGDIEFLDNWASHFVAEVDSLPYDTVGRDVCLTLLQGCHE